MQSGNYILIDYQNVQPTDFDLVPETGWHVKVFLGPGQVAKPACLNAAQRLGKHCEYINVLRSGRDALDFFIAYYLGILSRTKAEFYIISKDTGFDPLLEQLQAGNVIAQRYPAISLIPPLTPKPAVDAEFNDLVRKVIAHLQTLGDKRPKTWQKLKNKVKALHTTPEIAAAVVQNLEHRRIIKRTEEDVLIYLDSTTAKSAAA